MVIKPTKKSVKLGKLRNMHLTYFLLNNQSLSELSDSKKADEWLEKLSVEALIYTILFPKSSSSLARVYVTGCCTNGSHILGEISICFSTAFTSFLSCCVNS